VSLTYPDTSPDTGKGEKIPPGVEGLVRLGGKTA